MASVAILAGGRARRFGGTDKTALHVGGMTVLERQLAAARPLTTDILLVGSRRTTMPPDVRAIADRVSGAGPLAGLDAALHAARDPVVVLLAGDMPGITTALLEYLAAGASGAEAVVPSTERGYHPLCAAYTRDAAAAVADALARGEHRMLDLLAHLRVRTVGPEELARIGRPDRLLANLNTAADLNELETLLAHKL
jgi:molybdopterin-guanine dinucleotide biosynthesis protein A